MMDVARTAETLFGGPRVRLMVTPAATVQGPRIRTYAKRRAKSPRHWARMDKKYLKRYGFRRLPTAYQAQGGLFGRGELVIFVHPALEAEYRQAIRQAGGSTW